MATYYFSTTDGSDTNTSTQAQNPATPYKTITKLNSIFSTLAVGDTIAFKRGDVFVGTIVANKSGVSGNPIRFISYGTAQNKPKISGFANVSGYTSLGGNLYQTNAAIGSLAKCNMVLVNGIFAPIGRWPRTGFPAGATTPVNNKVDSHTGSDNQQNQAASITSAYLGSAPTGDWTAGSVGAEVVIRKRHWIIDKAVITSQSGNTLNYTNPTVYGATNNFGFFVQNHRSACTANGDWWYDTSSKKLGIYSSTGTPVGVQASTVDVLLNFGTQSWFLFDNIEFEGANTSAFTGSTAHDIVFNYCDFSSCGVDAFTMSFNSTANITLNTCIIDRVNNNVITAATSSGWNIHNCMITDVGQVAGMGANDSSTYNALSNIGPNSIIQYNTILRTGYIGIDFRGSGSTVKNNKVDTFCNIKDDGSGIYTFTGASAVVYTQRIVDGNIVLNGGGASAGTTTTNYDAHGIYMDDNSSNVTVKNNTVAHCGGAGLFLHANHDLIIQNNTFYDNAQTGPGNYGQILEVYPGVVNTSVPVRNLVITGNKFISKTSGQIVASYQTNETNMSLWPVSPASTNFNNNYYCRPIAENTSTFHIIRSSGTTNTNLAGWISASGGSLDANSHISPITITDAAKQRFEFNDTAGALPVALGSNTYVDVTGASYTGNISLPAYSSLYLIQTAGGNAAPTANAGADQTITLPVNSVTVTGSGTDSDGTISSYTWTKISGPSTFTINSPSSASTTISNLLQGVYTFRLTVTDNLGATATDDIVITVNSATNASPTANAGTDKSITLPTNSVTLSGSGTDSDGTITAYAWTKISGPSTFTIVSPASASTNITNLVQGTYVFQLQVTDNNGATGVDSVNVVVNPTPNVPPVANAGVDKLITAPTSTVTLTGSGTDSDGTISSYAWTKISGPSTFTIVSPTAATTVINNLVAGVYIFQLQVTDNSGATAVDTATVTVNTAPTANAGVDKSITLPTNSVTLTGSGTDPDGTISSYLWSKISGPSTFNINSPTSASTVVSSLVQGTYVFQLQVTDNNGSTATDTVSVVVNAAANVAPVANAGPNVTITLPTSSFSNHTGSATDSDGTIVSFLWTQVSGPATGVITGSNSTVMAVSGLTVAGTYVFRLTVTDNVGATGSDDFTVTVLPAVNALPVSNAGVDKNITLPTNSVTLTGGGTDSDGTIVTYAWSKVSGPTTFTINNPSSATTIVSNLIAGTYVFRLTVIDNAGGTDTDDTTVVVNAAANAIPTANAGVDQTIQLPTSSVTLNGSGIDTDGTITAYAWTKVSGPATYTITSPSSASTTVTGLVQGTYVFRLTVTDNAAATDTDDVTIVVNPVTSVNIAPVANAGPDKTVVSPNRTVSLAGAGTDSDGTVVSYHWTKISGPSRYTITSPNSASTTVTRLRRGTYTFRLTVTDNDGATGTDTVNVHVT